jgi:MarR-like DNA-binding transcriptional regulator SgrR of sgrS sRNA
MELDDLQPAAVPHPLPLSIQNRGQYFSVHAKDDAVTQLAPQFTLAESAQWIKQQLPAIHVTQVTQISQAQAVYDAYNQEIKIGMQSDAIQIPNEMGKVITLANELLRQFWITRNRVTELTNETVPIDELKPIAKRMQDTERRIHEITSAKGIQIVEPILGAFARAYQLAGIHTV